ncbi:unnamed protein product [Eruca vesicaria subsp. sativa]|uniref:Pentatricopeptide repeat-containing protein n=1 Tax=Eruca vesicaria subsp. sativa TaxID=29727 RepID=A0ABC8LZV2_ERUVS|nr:unnamed protein product [Eruca vesicaria subsp. sativa]
MPRFVQTRFLQTCTMFLSEQACKGKKVSYKERLRIGIVDNKKDDVVELFKSMLLSRPLPSIIHFSRLFSALAKTRQYELVLSLCQQMEFQGMKHNSYTVNIIINCFCRLRKLGFAFSIMGKGLKLGYEPNTITFSTLVNGLCLQVDRMVEMEVRPNLVTLNTLVNGLCLNSKVSEAVALVDRMVENGCQPDQFTYGPILNRICKSGDTSLALDLLRKMEDRKMGALKMRLIFSMKWKRKNTLIGGFCNAGRWDEAAQLMRDMITRGITPNVITFSALIDIFVKEGKHVEAKELYNEMIARGKDPDTVTYNT